MTERALAGSRLDVRCSDDPGDACAIGASAFVKRTLYTLDDPNRELPFGTTRQAVTTTSTGGQLAYTDDPADWLDARIGVGNAFERLIVDPIGPPESHAARFSARVFGELEAHATDWLDVRTAAALSSERTASGGEEDLVFVPSVRGGASAKPTEWLELFGAVAYYTRAPSLGELFGASASFLGNATLVPEAGPSGDVGARASTRADIVDFAAELVFFGRLAEDLIEYKRSAAGTVRPYNVGTARFLGAEALAAAKLAGFVSLDGSVAFTDARDVSEDRTLVNDRLPFQAPWVATAGASVDLDDLGPDEIVSGATAGAQFLYRSTRFADAAGLVTLPSQVLLDLEAGIRLTRDMLRFDVRISNVLGDVTTDLVGYPLPGRAFHAELTGDWR
jgi:iron complex outermembrane receptor protein